MAERAKRAFWFHQVAEYVLGLLVLSQAVQSPSPAVPLAFGVGILALAATADGPLGAYHLVSRPAHRVADLVVAALGAAAVAVNGFDLGDIGVLVIAIGAVALVVLVATTDYSPKRAKAPKAQNETDPAANAGRTAGRAVGRGLRAWRDRT